FFAEDTVAVVKPGEDPIEIRQSLLKPSQIGLVIRTWWDQDEFEESDSDEDEDDELKEFKKVGIMMGKANMSMY
ncbi:hypothetical protein HDV00_012393, partial [Rhizophlyctis rosea]